MRKESFNRGWRCNSVPVTLPHDAMLHGERSADAPSGSAGAYFPGGRYSYEKRFTAPQDEHLLLEFEDVYKNAKVYVNSRLAAQCAYGYLPFFVPLDGLLVKGENIIRVECENADQPDSRWYSGAGIYRPVWLWSGKGETIEPESVKITTLSIDPAVVRVESEIEAEFTVYAGYQAVAAGYGKDVELTIDNPKLWSAEHPYLYTLKAKTATDEAEIPFGVRKLEWSTKGFFVNGEQTLLRGGCIHHDSGILGAATYDEAEFRRARILKEGGFNAIRSAHNPTSRAMLEACDRLGLYVMDETWDMWFFHKTPHDYASFWREHYRDDIAAIVRRDYNHPSVVLYSIGNEVSEPCRDEGVEAAREMVELFHQLDASRPVTAGINLMILAQSAKGKFTFDPEKGRDTDSGQSGGMNSTMFNLITSFVGTGMNKAANSQKADKITSPVLDALDIAGYNYASGRYPLETKAHPDRVVVGSETFPQSLAENWAMVKKYPYLVGDFMWTCWDYLGETGIGAWAYTKDASGFSKPYPWLLADAGAFDILGDPNAEAFWAAAVWNKLDSPKITVQPLGRGKVTKAVWRGSNGIASWGWKNCGGSQAVVEVFAGEPAVSAELFLGGKSLGKAKFKGGVARFKVKYFPGTLSAAVYDASGREVGRAQLKSALGERKLSLCPEKESLRPGELVYIPAAIVGENGALESNADEKLRVTVENGELLGFGSANPRTQERYDAGEFTTYYGRALAIVRAGESGEVTVKVEGETLDAAQVTIPIE